VGDPRSFPQTGLGIDDNAFWNEFQRRGGVATFGYPISRSLMLDGLRIQFFQRQVMQVLPDGSLHLLNLADPGPVPYTSFERRCSLPLPQIKQPLAQRVR
jgi:hypothetical protein